MGVVVYFTYHEAKELNSTNTESLGTNISPRLLLLANEVCEGYVFTGVCLSTGGGGSASRVVGQTLPLKSDTTGYGQRAGGTHATGMHCCLSFLRIAGSC